MRLLLAALVSGCLLTATPARGDRTFPYKAYVTSDEVYVRSGPGQSYYPTEKLKAGQEIEVYRHDPGGWFAIKPPEGSFSWVSGRFLQPGHESLAIVNEDRVAARVGSRFSDIRDVIQVRLHQGEVIEVTDEVKSPTGDKRKSWYKIAPPSGEFRWVFGKYVDPEYPHDGLRRTEPPPQLPPLESAEADPVPATSAGPPTARYAAPKSAAASPAAATAATPVDRYKLPYATAENRRLTPEQYQEELTAIDIELSTMVVEEPTVWTFSGLRGRAEDLFDQAQTALERGQARVLLGKMDRFEDVKQRFDRMAALRERTDRVNERLASLGPPLSAAGSGTSADAAGGRYDGVGELTRVVSPKLDAPRYALVDADGSVRCYVTPAPGVNLRHYVGRQVGVNGTRGYMPEQRARHVMAQHVNVLDQRQLW